MAQPQRIRSQIKVDHDYLREALTWLEGAADLVSIADLLDDLSTYLIGHFAAEEAQGGLFDMIVDRAPQHRTKIDALRLDHKTLLAHVDAIRAGIESSWCPPGTEIRAKIAALVARLREHEHLEGRLLAQVLEAEFSDTLEGASVEPKVSGEPRGSAGRPPR